MGWETAGLPSNANKGRMHGGAAPLKSALQKDVRLCRAHSTVRVAMYLLKVRAKGAVCTATQCRNLPC